MQSKRHLLYAACSMCPGEIKQSLVGVLEQGVARPILLNLPNSAAGARFPQLCLRKLYVICSRGGGSDNMDGCLEDVRPRHCSLEPNMTDQLIETHDSS